MSVSDAALRLSGLGSSKQKEQKKIMDQYELSTLNKTTKSLLSSLMFLERYKDLVSENGRNYVRQRDKLKGACGICECNSICGGCRYTAYAISGDWLASDPSCPFGPKLSSRSPLPTTAMQ
jgi:radical SAM protein with 4Fe4S-binding SPASM domain